MNHYQKLELKNRLEKLLGKSIDLDAGNQLFNYHRQWNDTSIRLDREHIKIHPLCLLQTQSDYDNHQSMLKFLYQQLELGFKAKWLISIHLKHPTEKFRNVPEIYQVKGEIPKTRWGRKLISDGMENPQSSLWDECAYYNYYDKRRNDDFYTEEDNRQIKNLMLKYLYGIRRLNQTWRSNFPKNMLFIKEKGKVKLQYHIHLILPDVRDTLNTKFQILNVLNSNRNKARCLSSFKSIDVKEIDEPKKTLSYLNKETNGTHCSLDFSNSILLTK